MTVLNYTTKIKAEKTISEVQQLLAANGAARVAIDYAAGTATGVTFTLTTAHGPRLFTLPVDVDAMERLLSGMKPSGGIALAAFHTREHAERVAWRVIKDWLAAQLTLIQSSMAGLDQVMLPYLHIDQDGRTLYAAYRERENVLALESPTR